MAGPMRRLGRFRRPGRAGLAARIDHLERRLANLESVIEGLQDSMHREARRRDEETAELRHRTEPGEMARALSDDARRRGL
jgi:uncharacterized coiled-coil protein SlyX